MEPGLIAGEVNRILAAHAKKNKLPVQYKIGPDPSSIDSCMIGGIVANNSSGMCCGVSQNTYHTLKDMRVVFVDGTVLDTADPASCASFMRTHKKLVDGVQAIARRVQSDKELTALIRRKFAIKCTTGEWRTARGAAARAGQHTGANYRGPAPGLQASHSLSFSPRRRSRI